MDDLVERITECERKGFSLVEGSAESVWWFARSWSRMPESWQAWATQEGLTEEHVCTTLDEDDAKKQAMQASRVEHQRVLKSVKEKEHKQQKIARDESIDAAEESCFVLDNIRLNLAVGRDVRQTGWLDDLDGETVPTFPRRRRQTFERRARETYISKNLPHESLSDDAAAALKTMWLMDMDLPENGLVDYPNLTELSLGPDGTPNSPIRIPESLRSLRFYGTNYSMGSVADGLGNLETLHFFVDGMPDLNHIQQLPKLRDLGTVGRGIREILEHIQLPALQALHLREEVPSDLRFLRHIPHIKSLTLVDAEVDLTGLSEGLALESLVLARCTADLSCLGELTTLKSLTIAHEDVETLPSIAKLTGLETLILDLPNSANVEFLRPLTGLTTLTLKIGPGCTNLDAIVALTSLHTLTVHNSGATDLSALRFLTKLGTLDLTGNEHWDGNTSVLSNARRLRTLTLHHVPAAALEHLPELTGLDDLDFAPTERVDLRPLLKLTNLKRLALDGEPINNTHDWFQENTPENVLHDAVFTAGTTTIPPTERPWPSQWLHTDGQTLSTPDCDALLAVVYDVGRRVPLQAWIMDSEGTPHRVVATVWDERLGRLKEPLMAFESLVTHRPDSFCVVRHQSYGVICPTALVKASNGPRSFLEDLEGLTDKWVDTALNVLGWHHPTHGELTRSLALTKHLSEQGSAEWDRVGEPHRLEQFQRALFILSGANNRASPGESFAQRAHGQLAEWLTDNHSGQDLCPLRQVLPQSPAEPAMTSVRPHEKSYHPFATTHAPMPTLPTLKDGPRLRLMGCTGFMDIEPVRGTHWGVVRIGPHCGYGDAEAYGELSFDIRTRDSYAPQAWGQPSSPLAETAVNPVTCPQWFATSRSLPMNFDGWKTSFSSHHVSGGWDYNRVSGAPGCMTLDTNETLRRIQEAVELDRFLLSQSNGRMDKATLIAGMVAKQDMDGENGGYPIYSDMETEDVERLALCRELVQCLATATSNIVNVPVYGRAYRLRLPPVAYSHGYDARADFGVYEVFVVPCVSQHTS